MFLFHIEVSLPLSPSFPFSLKSISCPGWYGSVARALTCETKGRWFNSQSRHMPGLWARSSVRGVREATTHGCFSPSLSLSLPLFLKINKIFFLMGALFVPDPVYWVSLCAWHRAGIRTWVYQPPEHPQSYPAKAREQRQFPASVQAQPGPSAGGWRWAAP